MLEIAFVKDKRIFPVNLFPTDQIVSPQNAIPLSVNLVSKFSLLSFVKEQNPNKAFVIRYLEW